MNSRPVAMELCGISHTFARNRREQTVLKNVDLTVCETEFVAIMGASGSGKSTLLNIAAGFILPSQGVVRCAGRAVTGPGADRGIVAQSPALFPWMSVLDNVLFGPGARGRKTKTEEAITAPQLLSDVGLTGAESKRPYELSGGMQHRAALARAIANRPQILLMDEPFAALDAETRDEMQQWLLRLWEIRKLTVLFVTHDIEEGLLLADRVVILSAATASVAHEITVPIPRPRTEDTILTHDFVALRREVRNLLRADRALALHQLELSRPRTPQDQPAKDR